MPHRVNASNILRVKTMLEKRGCLDAALDRLTPETSLIFTGSRDDSWIPFAAEAAIYEAAARLLYPFDPNRLRQIGYDVACVQLQGRYRFFLIIATVEHLIGQVLQIWKTTFDSGTVRLLNLGVSGGVMEVNDLPDLMPAQREVICGYLTALLEMTNVKNVQVIPDDSNPAAWKWAVRWERK